MAKAIEPNQEIDPIKIKIILKQIILEEKNNLNTKEKTKTQMIEKIKQIIEEEIDAYS